MLTAGFQISMKISARFLDSSVDFVILILNFRVMWLFTAYMHIDTVYRQKLAFINTLYFMYVRYRHNVQPGHRHLHACMHIDHRQCTRNLQYRYLHPGTRLVWKWLYRAHTTVVGSALDSRRQTVWLKIASEPTWEAQKWKKISGGVCPQPPSPSCFFSAFALKFSQK